MVDGGLAARYTAPMTNSARYLPREFHISEDDLPDVIREWQVVLRLQDWNIVARILRRDEGSMDNLAGANRFTVPNKESIITLLDPIDYPFDCSFPQDMEVTLVHELLHLHLAPIHLALNNLECVSELSLDMLSNAEEQAIGAISEALVSLKRRSSLGSGEG